MTAEPGELAHSPCNLDEGFIPEILDEAGARPPDQGLRAGGPSGHPGAARAGVDLRRHLLARALIDLFGAR